MVCKKQPAPAGSNTVILNERLLNAILSISRCATLDDALEPLLDAAIDVTQTTGGGVYCVESDTLVLRHHCGLPETFTREVVRVPLTAPWVQRLLREQGPTEVTDIPPTMRELREKHGIRHVFSFALRADGVFFGVLNIASTEVDPPETTALQGLWFLMHEIQSLFGRLHSEKILRDSELRCKTLWHAAMDGLMVYELSDAPGKGRLIDVNDYACRTLGYSREELLKMSSFDLLPEDQREKIGQIIAEARQSGRKLFEVTVLTKDGRRIATEIQASLAMLDGRTTLFTIVRDVTQRKRIEAMLQEANENLEQQVRARTTELTHMIDQLLAAKTELEHRTGQLQKLTMELTQAEDRERKRVAAFLHDDLQRILAAIRPPLDTLGHRIGTDPQAAAALEQTRQMIEEAIEKAGRLSNELGPPVECGNRLDAIFEWLADRMRRKHDLVVHTEFPGVVRSDSEAVRSFLCSTAEELLLNVAKHAQVKEANLRLQQVQDEFLLIISDWGRGFDPASLAKTGGLGLLTIRERTESLGGRIKIQSAPGKGSVFFIAVPDADAPCATSEGPLQPDGVTLN